jgi:hypothetical protein
MTLFNTPRDGASSAVSQIVTFKIQQFFQSIYAPGMGSITHVDTNYNYNYFLFYSYQLQLQLHLHFLRSITITITLLQIQLQLQLLLKCMKSICVALYDLCVCYLSYVD